MKRVSLLFAILLLAVGFVHTQDKSYRVVFDLTSRDSLDHKAAMRWVHEITSANPHAQVEVVMYGKGFEMVMPERSAVIAEVEKAMKNPNVSFRVCRIAMKNNNIDKSQLVKGVQTVPDGIYEIVSKQHEGWGYIKVVH
jgi:intracellular sulfur oxidation DsrE/DsrF family protein